MIVMVNMYVYLTFGENLTTNMGDMAKSLFLRFFLLLLFFSLNPSISRTVTGIYRSEICIQVGSDDPTCSDLSKCLKTMSFACKQHQ